ncbi:DNA helicase [Malassezia caprae]|uniref:ATP-dependent DNA helicase n=1 Tax=Malassezia caprae TaxID=1381934 RepID=A0AAF0IWG9_9BASI|nr:DNA helicase [Malassezia caprae]
MAEFDEFDDDLVGSEWLAQVDAIEAKCLHARPPPAPPSKPPREDALDPGLEELLLQGFDQLDDEIHRSQGVREPLEDTTNVQAARPDPSKPTALTQQGLFGRPVREAPPSRSTPRAAPAPSEETASQVHTAQGLVSLAAAQGAMLGLRSGKVWDNRIFLQQQNRVEKRAPDDDGSEELLAEPMPHSSPRPMTVALDAEQAQTWIYPINKPLRSYQLNIVKKALFNNVLVALPTGLGKTFIAAVVILNYVRWFPQGKIIFVAPTRPLVNQQQQACHSICGLPWDLAIELTGSTKRSLRDDEWKNKRIFYMTPQTFENDLLSTTCDPSEVVCVVVDEAHRATGNYAYCKVIRHLMYFNPHFRVLALTATPGNHAERVQEVVNNLHINRIEIRTEDALDIQPYLHKKREDLVRVPLHGALDSLRRRWATLMHVYYDPLHKHGVLRACDPAQLRAFAVRSAGGDPNGRAILQARPFLRGFLQQLATMAQIMQYLTEQSVRVFCERVQAMSAPGKGTTKREQVFSTQNATFRDLLEDIETVQADAELIVHPKMQTLRDVLARHFAERDSTRAMVFCTFREVVNEIVALLCAAGIRATPFVGQASDSKGNRGYTQRVQEQVIRDFQQGTYQVLVATSIGEEGLDIGEVDLIVCYDAVRDSVRGLQRIGRTGRLRDGRVVVLMSEGREESNWHHSKESYKCVQRLVRDARTIELYTDVPRLVPHHIQPEPIMREVEQPAPEPAQLRPSAKRERREKTPRKIKRRAPPPPDTKLTFCWATELRRRDEHREGVVEDASPEPEERPRSSSSSLLRSSSLNGTANLSDDSDDQALCAPLSARSSSAFSWSPTQASRPAAPPKAVCSRAESAPVARGRTLGVRPALRSPSAVPAASPPRFAPHPLVAALDEGLEELDVRPSSSIAESAPLFFSPERTLSPSLHVPAPAPAPAAPSCASPVRAPRKRRRPASHQLWVDEAERDTDSDVHGESDEDDDGPSTSEENDEDRAAVGDFMPTQQTGYNQQAVYMQSMLSQEAPTPFRRRDRLWELLQRRDAMRPSSEAEAHSVDEYSQDSFVVGDDEISWDSSQASSAD